jgi:hypothetical protein
VKESCIQDLDNKFILSLHSHEHYMAFILIYLWLCLENEEEVEVSEEKAPPPSDSQAGSCLYFDICGPESDSPTNEGKPRCICHLP